MDLTDLHSHDSVPSTYKPTHAGHLHHPALARRLRTPRLGRILANEPPRVSRRARYVRTFNEVQRLGSVDGSRLLLSEPDEVLMAKDRSLAEGWEAHPHRRWPIAVVHFRRHDEFVTSLDNP